MIPAPAPPLAVLVIEDIPSLRSIYAAHLRERGYEPVCAASALEGTRLFRQRADLRIVLLDLLLPDGDGVNVMGDLLRLRPETAVIVLTADRSIDRAVTAMRAGAMDFLIKPVAEERLDAAVENARASLALAAPPIRAPGGEAAAPQSFIGVSQQMQDVYARIRSAARTMAPVFITGENGTGKEMCAQAIHAVSPRAAEPFITLDCASISAERFDSEVFGHVRGAFPGALGDHPGLAAQADGGTLFLDEICELDPAAQPKLLRFLQNASFTPLGSSERRGVNLRVIAASSIPPLDAVQAGRLREELYYRLHVVPIRMPALRERPEDVDLLAADLLARYARMERRAFARLAPDALAILRRQPWPGNVRQLMSVLRAVAVMHDGEELTPRMLPDDMIAAPCPAAAAPQTVDARPADPAAALAGRSLTEIERMAIEAALARNEGSVPRAARELDVSPSTIYRKLESWRGAED